MIQVGRKQTMTVGELIAALQLVDPQEAVMATWEGIIAPITTDGFGGEKIDGVRCLIIDVGDY